MPASWSQSDACGAPTCVRETSTSSASDAVEALGAGELAAELEQRVRALRLAALSLVETRVLERDRGVAGEHLEQA